MQATAEFEKKQVPITQPVFCDCMGRLTIPAKVRKYFNIRQGDQFKLITLEGGDLLYKRQP